MTATVSAPSATSSRTGAQEVVDFLAARGDRHVFGVPGSSLAPMFHALGGSPVSYVPAIHEAAAVAAADGYARVTGSACVLLYMAEGVANCMANLLNAWSAESPLLLLAGQPDSTDLTGLGGIIGEGDVVDMARHVTRWGQAVPRGSSLREWLERADRIAAGPPGGPVLLSVPEDLFSGPAVPAVDIRAGRRVAPGAPDLSEVAAALAAAQNPLIVAGAQIARFGGTPALVSLAEQLQIPVIYEYGFVDQKSIPADHPNCLGWALMPAGQRLQQEADVVLGVGCRLVLEDHAPVPLRFPDAQFIAHVNADPAKLEALTHAHWSCACSPAAFLQGLLDTAAGTPTDAALLQRRRARVVQAKQRQAGELPTESWVSALSDALDHGWVVDEAISLSPLFANSLRGDGSRWLSMSGASLGWATGAACGVALGSGEPVTALLGDGATRFGAAGLWTAKACELPITYVVLDNGGFGSTRSYERMYASSVGAAPTYVGSDLHGLGAPVADMIAGYGIPTTTISANDDVRSAVVKAWNTKGPNALVIDVGFNAGAWG